MSAESMHSVWARSLSLTHSGHVFMFGFPRCGNTQPALAHNRLCTVITAVFMRVILWSWSVVQILRVDYHIYLHNVNEKQSQGWSGDSFFSVYLSVLCGLYAQNIYWESASALFLHEIDDSVIFRKSENIVILFDFWFLNRNTTFDSLISYTHTHIYIYFLLLTKKWRTCFWTTDNTKGSSLYRLTFSSL